MQGEKLQRAVGAINVRFGSQALVRANRLAGALAWPTGQPAVDRLSGIGGLPRGRVSVLQGRTGCGKRSLALALLARATREHARSAVIDRVRAFDPWIPHRLGADLGAVAVIRPRTRSVAGEAAVALARAGAGFVLAFDALPEPALAPLESAAARSGCLVLAVGEGGGRSRALAHASSLTLELEPLGVVWERRLVVGLHSRLRCVKNRLAAPGREAEVEVRYPVAPRLPAAEEPREVGPEEPADVGPEEPADGMVPWLSRSAAG